MNEACRTHEWVMAHKWMRHAAHMNESCRTYEWGMTHTRMSHVTHMNEAWRTHGWVMSHTWMSHACDVAHMDESCRTYRRVMSHISICHVTHTNKRWCTYEWVMSHIWMSHDTHIKESRRKTLHVRLDLRHRDILCRIHMRDMTHVTHTEGDTGNSCHTHEYRVGKTHRMPLSCRSCFAKEPLIIGLFCGKWPIKIESLNDL